VESFEQQENNSMLYEILGIFGKDRLVSKFWT